MCSWTSGESTRHLMAQYWEDPLSQHLLAFYVAIQLAVSPTSPGIMDELHLSRHTQNSYTLPRDVLYTSESGQGAPHSFRHLTSFLH